MAAHRKGTTLNYKEKDAQSRKMEQANVSWPKHKFNSWYEISSRETPLMGISIHMGP